MFICPRFIKTIIINSSCMQVRGFYKGVVPPFFGQGCINAITFGVEDNVAKYVTSKKDNVYFKHLKTGMTAGFVQVFVCTPMELVKLHTQHQKIGEVGRYQGNWATLMKILRAEGITGCYRGLFVTAVRDVSGFGVYFAAYEGLMDSFARMQGKHRDELGFVPQFLLGGTAGVASWLCNYPVELIKTRFQMDGFIGERQYKSSFDVLLKELRQGGKLFRGIVPCLHRAFLFNSFTFPVVEFVKGWKSKKIE